MPNVSIETANLLARVAFLVGAVTDALALVPMLSRRAGAKIFGGDPSRGGPEYRFAMGLGASLMAGWTLLLLWGAASPIERRFLFLLTLVPVVAGIVAAAYLAVAGDHRHPLARSGTEEFHAHGAAKIADPRTGPPFGCAPTFPKGGGFTRACSLPLGRQ